jgi:hypothetical protein
MENNKNLKQLEHIVKNSIYGNADIISQKNTLFEKCLNNICKHFYNDDFSEFNKYMENYFYILHYDIEKVNLDKIYLSFIKSTIICNIFGTEEYENYPLKLSDYSELFNIKIDEKVYSDYHSDHSYYHIDSMLMVPELLSVINKYSDCDVDIVISNGRLSLLPKNGYNAINYILDENNDISSKYDITSTLEMFRELYIKLNKVNEFINNKILNI